MFAAFLCWWVSLVGPSVGRTIGPSVAFSHLGRGLPFLFSLVKDGKKIFILLLRTYRKSLKGKVKTANTKQGMFVKYLVERERENIPKNIIFDFYILHINSTLHLPFVERKARAEKRCYPCVS